MPRLGVVVVVALLASLVLGVATPAWAQDETVYGKRLTVTVSVDKTYLDKLLGSGFSTDIVVVLDLDRTVGNFTYSYIVASTTDNVRMDYYFRLVAGKYRVYVDVPYSIWSAGNFSFYLYLLRERLEAAVVTTGFFLLFDDFIPTSTSVVLDPRASIASTTVTGVANDTENITALIPGSAGTGFSAEGPYIVEVGVNYDNDTALLVGLDPGLQLPGPDANISYQDSLPGVYTFNLSAGAGIYRGVFDVANDVAYLIDPLNQILQTQTASAGDPLPLAGAIGLGRQYIIDYVAVYHAVPPSKLSVNIDVIENVQPPVVLNVGPGAADYAVLVPRTEPIRISGATVYVYGTGNGTLLFSYMYIPQYGELPPEAVIEVYDPAGNLLENFTIGGSAATWEKDFGFYYDIENRTYTGVEEFTVKVKIQGQEAVVVVHSATAERDLDLVDLLMIGLLFSMAWTGDVRRAALGMALYGLVGVFLAGLGVADQYIVVSSTLALVAGGTLLFLEK